MTIKILDCTLRDGGYVNSWEFGSEEIKHIISSLNNAKIDYIEIVDSLSLKPVDKVEKSVLVALAVYIGKTRLIDNFTFEV